jgi:hypothetical protein
VALKIFWVLGFPNDFSDIVGAVLFIFRVRAVAMRYASLII